MNSDDNSFPGIQPGMRRVRTRDVPHSFAWRSLGRAIAVAVMLGTAHCASALNSDPAFPAADGLLAAVRARFPQEPVGIHGQLIVRSPRISDRIRLNVDVTLDWGTAPTLSSYTVRDYFGAPLSRLTVRREASGEPRYAFSSGAELTNAVLPDLASSIRDTDISWLDLSLAYLWWPGGETVGVESVLGQRCYIIYLEAPQRAQSGYSNVKLWISVKSMMLLRAEAYDANDALVRRVALKSFKKIDDQWVAKRVDVTSHPSGHRTRLLVRSVAATGGSDNPGANVAGDGD